MKHINALPLKSDPGMLLLGNRKKKAPFGCRELYLWGNWIIMVFPCITMYIPYVSLVGYSADLYKCLMFLWFCGITG